MMPWNRNDQIRLNNARETVAKLEVARAASVSELADYLKRLGVQKAWTAPPVPGSLSASLLDGNFVEAAKTLADHADTIRDLLSPFDSGVRPAEAQDTAK